MSLNAPDVDVDKSYLPNQLEFGWGFDNSDLL